MDDAQYLAAITSDSAALLEAATAADPASTVPACPAWSPTDLIWHVGVVHAFWGTVVGERLDAPPQPWPPERPANAEGVVEFAHRAAADLVAALGAADPAATVWTWTGPQDARWVFRRMAQETAMHRVDAEQTAGRAAAIDAALASDGIDEFLTVMLRHQADTPASLGGSVHLHCTDALGEWTITPSSDGALTVTHEHTKADTAMRGPASSLLLALWRRIDVADPNAEITVFGDEQLATRFLALTSND